MNSSDSAEEFVKIYLDGIDHAIRVAGVGAKNVGAMLIALSKDKKQTKGKTRLTNMIKTGKSVQIFTIEAKDLKKFSQEAKRYGILYCVLAKKKNSKIDGVVDIMVRDEDAPKVNRIAKRFNFRSVASVKQDLETEKQAKQNEEKIKTEDEKFIDDIMPVEIEEQLEKSSNDTKNTEEKNLLEPSLNTKLKDKKKNSKDKQNFKDKKKSTDKRKSKDEKKSVRKELKDIEEEIKAKELATEKQGEKQETRINTTITSKKEKKPKHTKEEKEVKKGKRFKEPKHFDNAKKKKRRKKKERSM